jgi:hypothetical protein
MMPLFWRYADLIVFCLDLVGKPVLNPATFGGFW